MSLPGDSGDRDPFLWLGEVEGAEALAWGAEQNRATHAALAEGRLGFDALRAASGRSSSGSRGRRSAMSDPDEGCVESDGKPAAFPGGCEWGMETGRPAG